MTNLELKFCELIMYLNETDHEAERLKSLATRVIAQDKFKSGQKPEFSSGICGSATAGYGSLNSFGYFQFPLYVNQETQKVMIVDLNSRF